MGSRGGKEATSFSFEKMSEAYGQLKDFEHKDIIDKLILSIYKREESAAKEYLLKTFVNLNAALGREDKAKKAAEKDTLSDLAIKVCAMAELVNGMYLAAEARRKETLSLLNDALQPYRIAASNRETEKPLKESALEPARDDVQAAIEAVFRIRFQKIINESLEEQLKQNRQGV